MVFQIFAGAAMDVADSVNGQMGEQRVDPDQHQSDEEFFIIFFT